LGSGKVKKISGPWQKKAHVPGEYKGTWWIMGVSIDRLKQQTTSGGLKSKNLHKLKAG